MSLLLRVFGEFILLSVQPVALATSVVKPTHSRSPCFRASHRFSGLRFLLRKLPIYYENGVSQENSQLHRRRGLQFLRREHHGLVQIRQDHHAAVEKDVPQARTATLERLSTTMDWTLRL